MYKYTRNDLLRDLKAREHRNYFLILPYLFGSRSSEKQGEKEIIIIIIISFFFFIFTCLIFSFFFFFSLNRILFSKFLKIMFLSYGFIIKVSKSKKATKNDGTDIIDTLRHERNIAGKHMNTFL